MDADKQMNKKFSKMRNKACLIGGVWHSANNRKLYRNSALRVVRDPGPLLPADRFSFGEAELEELCAPCKSTLKYN